MANDFERSLRPLELRAEGRKLAGIVLRYGDISPTHRERFAPGAFGDLRDQVRWLDYRHDQHRVLAHTEGGGLVLEDSSESLSLRAELPPLPLTTRALEEIASGALSGLSIEFHAREESRTEGIRVIEKAELAGIGLVPSPSYPDSRVELRQAGTISGSIPYGQPLQCECYGRGQSGESGKGMTSVVELTPESLILPPNLIAIWKSMATPLGSLDKGTLRVTPGAAGLDVEIDIPDTSYGRDIIETADSVPIRIRPMFDASEVEAVDLPPGLGSSDVPVPAGLTGKAREEFITSYLKGFNATDDALANMRRARLTNVPVRALLIGPTPNGGGWPEARITPDAEGRERASRRERKERFAWL